MIDGDQEWWDSRRYSCWVEASFWCHPYWRVELTEGIGEGDRGVCMEGGCGQLGMHCCEDFSLLLPLLLHPGFLSSLLGWHDSWAEPHKSRHRLLFPSFFSSSLPHPCSFWSCPLMSLCSSPRRTAAVRSLIFARREFYFLKSPQGWFEPPTLSTIRRRRANHCATDSRLLDRVTYTYFATKKSARQWVRTLKTLTVVQLRTSPV